MSQAKKKPYPSKRLFENDFFEAFSHVHASIPAIVYLPVVTYLLWKSVEVFHWGFSALLGWALSGVLLWTLAEYSLHRWVFHLHLPGRFGERFHELFHGIHHEQADDPSRLVMPPVVSIVLAVVFYKGFESLLGARSATPLFAFFIVGYLCYDYTHFYVHHFNPKTALGKYLKKNHMLHHYAADEAKWGVSSPLWDLVFDTYKMPEKFSKQQKAGA
jgi:sterol desaturase/sphingolipid hydroxylase (fatty acid hydroxylase superfamily)